MFPNKHGCRQLCLMWHGIVETYEPPANIWQGVRFFLILSMTVLSEEDFGKDKDHWYANNK